jgi:hypothetical protein
MSANGPAIKGVSVAERLKAGKQRSGRKYNAMRPEGAKQGAVFAVKLQVFFKFYECRGTRVVASRSQVKVY